eukprot:m.357083 g.357083  ORF g.357083 m.357083 type:complete len:56 (+) comp17695_c0_seq1:8195-8362(+)
MVVYVFVIVLCRLQPCHLSASVYCAEHHIALVDAHTFLIVLAHVCLSTNKAWHHE